MQPSEPDEPAAPPAEPEPRGARPARGALWLPALLCFAVGLALYWPTLRLDWPLLDAPSNLKYSVRFVEKLLREPSLANLRNDKELNRIIPVFYLQRHALIRAFGLTQWKHQAAHLALLLVHFLLLAALFRRAAGTGWWALPAAAVYLFFIPSDWNTPAYNWYPTMTLEPLLVAELGIFLWLMALPRRRHIPVRAGVALLASAMALAIAFTKESAVFYLPGVVAAAAALWVGGARRATPWIAAAAYACACGLFLAVYGRVIGFSNALAPEGGHGGSAASRLGSIIAVFGDTLGPLWIVMIASYALCAAARWRGDFDKPLRFGIDAAAWAFVVVPVGQLAAWPNYQQRLLLPQVAAVAVVFGLCLWRLGVLARYFAPIAPHMPTPDFDRRIRRAAAWSMTAGVVLLVPYAGLALMGYANFRTLYRGNETCRVLAYHEAVRQLTPGARLLVALGPYDQITNEIRHRADFMDRIPNAVVDLQPGTATPRAGDVIFYHRAMARVRLEGSDLERTPVRQSGELFVHTGWSGFIGALLRLRNPVERRSGGNEYTVMRVRPPAP